MPIDTNEIYFLAFVSVSYASLAAGFAVQYSRLPIERPALWPATVAWFWLILGGLQLGSKSISIFAHGYRALASVVVTLAVLLLATALTIDMRTLLRRRAHGAGNA